MEICQLFEEDVVKIRSTSKKLDLNKRYKPQKFIKIPQVLNSALNLQNNGGEMQSNFIPLVKKQIIEEFHFLRQKKRPDILGVVLSLSLAAVFIFAVIFIFRKFIPIYTAVPFDHIYDIESRKFEILTVVYSFVLIAGIFSGVRNINNSIFESEDLKIIVYLPVKPTSFLFAKIIGAYLKSLFTTALIVLPVNLTFGIVSNTGLHFVFSTVAVCLFLPLLNISIATIIALPAYFIKRLLGGKYFVMLILLVALLGFLLWGYSAILNAIKSLLENKEFSLFFNRENMQIIINVTKYLYPSNLLANVLLKRTLLFSSLILLSILAVTTLISFFIAKFLLNGAMIKRFEGSDLFVYHKNTKSKKRSVFFALVRKEYLNVLRVPGYAFQYFATALIMPLMVYISLSLTVSLANNLLFVNSSFELCLFVIMAFNVLTNTFCATNISREGPMFYASKTMPFNHRQIVFSKLFFSSLVAVFSLVSCVIMVASLGYATPLQSLFIFFVTLCLSLAQIAFATRMDFNRPHFSTDTSGEIKESNSTVSTIIVLGLLFSLFTGALTLYLSMFFELKLLPLWSDLITYLIVGVCAVVMLALGIVFLLKNLSKKYYLAEKS